MTKRPNNHPIVTRLYEIDMGIFELLEEKMRLQQELLEWRLEHKSDLDHTAIPEEEVLNHIKSRNKTLSLPDEKILLLWGKIIELSDHHHKS